MKLIEFHGISLAAIRGFPDAARREAGYQLDRVQHGLNPADWKPMQSIGRGVREIRIRSEGQFRVIYVTGFKNRVVVLHAFVKKTRATRATDIEKARNAYKSVMVGAK
jgi:phage-related protein